MKTSTLIKLFFYSFTTVLFGSLHGFATQLFEEQEIQHHNKGRGSLVFECPKDGNSIELRTEQEKIQAIGYRLDENLHEFLDKKKYNAGTILYGKKERTLSFLSLKADIGDALQCTGYFKHSKQILFQGLYFSFNQCAFSPGSLVTIQPKTAHNQNKLKFLRLIPVDPSMSIYIHGRVDIKNIDFSPNNATHPYFFVVNAHIEFLLGE